MARSALILGGTGLIGRAVARRLLAADWRVMVTGRDPRRMPADLAAAGVEFRMVDRDDAAALGAAVADGCDFLVDCVCYTGAQARLLRPMLDGVGSVMMISSKAVYVDDDGNHVNSARAPRFAGPVTEHHRAGLARQWLAGDGSAALEGAWRRGGPAARVVLPEACP